MAVQDTVFPPVTTQADVDTVFVTEHINVLLVLAVAAVVEPIVFVEELELVVEDIVVAVVEAADAEASVVVASVVVFAVVFSVVEASVVVVSVEPVESALLLNSSRTSSTSY